MRRKLLFNYRRNVLCVIKPAGDNSDDPKVDGMAPLTHSRAWQGSTQMGGGEGEGEGEGVRGCIQISSLLLSVFSIRCILFFCKHNFPGSISQVSENTCR